MSRRSASIPWIDNASHAVTNDDRFNELLEAIESTLSGSVAGFLLPGNKPWIGSDNHLTENFEPNSDSSRKSFWSNIPIVFTNLEGNREPPPSPIFEIAQPLSDSSRNYDTDSYCRIHQERDRFKSHFHFLAQDSNFEYGYLSETDRFLTSSIEKFGPLAKEWIEELFLENIHDRTVTCAILRTLAHQEYVNIYPQGVTIAIAAMRQNDYEIKENGIRCFENWENPTCLKILECLSIPEVPWLNDYLKSVIESLQGVEENVTAR
ncbi:MAG: hypothetical protein Q7J31_05905 [Syntrophales bacterium]|nr:hypothetical protein [Syntrophales bacterium]